MNDSLKKLESINAFLRDMEFRERPDIRFHYITGQEDAAILLKDVAGIRVLAARPEERIVFDRSGTASETIETVFFVLDKDLDAGKTPERECKQYDGLLEIVQLLLDYLMDRCDSCCRLAGLRISNAVVRPEVKVFGSWNGYSLALTFK